MHSVSLWSFPSLDKKDSQPASSNLKGTGSRSVVAFQTGLTGFSESLTLSFSRLFVTWLVGFETNTETKKEKGKVNYQALKTFNKLFAEGEVNIFRLIHNILTIFTEPSRNNCFSTITKVLSNSVVNIRFDVKKFSFNCFDYSYRGIEPASIRIWWVHSIKSTKTSYPSVKKVSLQT